MNTLHYSCPSCWQTASVPVDQVWLVRGFEDSYLARCPNCGVLYTQVVEGVFVQELFEAGVMVIGEPDAVGLRLMEAGLLP